MIPKSGVRFSDKIMRRKEGGEAPKGACQTCPRGIAAEVDCDIGRDAGYRLEARRYLERKTNTTDLTQL